MEGLCCGHLYTRLTQLVIGQRFIDNLRERFQAAVSLLQDAQEAVFHIEVAGKVGKVDEDGGGKVV